MSINSLKPYFAPVCECAEHICWKARTDIGATLTCLKTDKNGNDYQSIDTSRSNGVIPYCGKSPRDLTTEIELQQSCAPAA